MLRRMMGAVEHRPRVAITGVTGFIGRRLAQRCLAEGAYVRGIVRRPISSDSSGAELVQVSETAGIAEWRDALDGIDAVVHLAALTHAIRDRGSDNLGEYRRINVGGSRRVAEGAVAADVGRLIFVSSIKVQGERTASRPFRAEDPPAPEDAYGVSKWEAEQAIAGVTGRSGLEAVVIRPPLVYGPGVRGNFERLRRAVERGVVLPFGAVRNRRSMVAVDNLVDFVTCCITHPAAPGKTFLVSDGEDLSTPELIRQLARFMGRKARLISVPPRMLRLGGRLAGRSRELARLLDSLQVDIEDSCRTLGWSPRLTVGEGLAKAVADG